MADWNETIKKLRQSWREIGQKLEDLFDHHGVDLSRMGEPEKNNKEIIT